jgi:FMN phosphatase YigB (HAD superfamily)
VRRISGRDFMQAIGTHVQDQHGLRIDLSALAAALAYDVEPRMIDLLRELHGRVKLAILHLVAALGVDPPAIVCFDDLEENLPARELGMVAFRFETPEVCRRQLADVGVL